MVILWMRASLAVDDRCDDTNRYWNPQQKQLYALQHGRDDLYRSWPQYYSRWQSAVLP